jgi:predicted nucleotidyltransferase
MIFGSHLYGTNTENSDTDYKGVFLPTARDCYLGRIPKAMSVGTQKEEGTKNSAEDVDEEIYSLQHFIKMACSGEMVAMDMLHAPEEALLETSDLWRRIVAERKRFYTRDMRAFVGYARKQAAKYGIRGSRLDTLSQIIFILLRYHRETRLGDVNELDGLTLEHYRKTKRVLGKRIITSYEICGKQYEDTVKVGYALDSIHQYRESFGHRAEAAKENQGIDWKAVSHAIRAGLQIKEMYQDGVVTFPLKQRDLVLAIKQGKMDFTTEVSPLLDTIMQEVEALAAVSTLPETVDFAFWEDFIEEAYTCGS